MNKTHFSELIQKFRFVSQPIQTESQMDSENVKVFIFCTVLLKVTHKAEQSGSFIIMWSSDAHKDAHRRLAKNLIKWRKSFRENEMLSAKLF